MVKDTAQWYQICKKKTKLQEVYTFNSWYKLKITILWYSYSWIMSKYINFFRPNCKISKTWIIQYLTAIHIIRRWNAYQWNLQREFGNNKKSNNKRLYSYLRNPCQYMGGIKSFFIWNIVLLSTPWLTGKVSSGCKL